MSVLDEGNLVYIYGISECFSEDVFDLDFRDVERFWFKEIDKIYFSRKRFVIILSNEDKYIIRRSKDCYDKLKSLSYKKNVKIRELVEVYF